MNWFMQQIQNGFFEVINPYNRKKKVVPATAQKVHTIVFWSKNFGPFLTQGYGEKLQAMGYHLFFNYTVNSRSPLLEPAVPELNQRLDQLRQLCQRFGAAAVQWRFDPICHFKLNDGSIETNLADFQTIAAAAGECGIDTCISSFMDPYPKIARRTGGRLAFVQPDLAQQVDILINMEAALSPHGIRLALCCEKTVLKALPSTSAIGPAACISGATIMAVHGGRVSCRRDSGQRRSSGCGCTASVDVGSYNLHPCHHNCLFCYANPACDQRGRQ